MEPGHQPQQKNAHQGRSAGPLLGALGLVGLLLGAIPAWFAFHPVASDPRITHLDGPPATPQIETNAEAHADWIAPDFELETADGKTVSLSDFRGQVVLVNFWATWCGPCRKEMPALNAWARSQAGEGIVVLGVNVAEDAGTVSDFTAKYGLDFPIVLDTDGRVRDLYRVPGAPATYLIDRDGTIAKVVLGPLDDADFATFIRMTAEAKD